MRATVRRAVKNDGGITIQLFCMGRGSVLGNLSVSALDFDSLHPFVQVVLAASGWLPNFGKLSR